MDGMKEWPAALLRTWAISVTFGVLYLAVGIAVFVALDDRTMLLISLVLSTAVILRSWMLYKRICGHCYEVVEGVCVKIRRSGLHRQRCICLMDDAGEQHIVTLDKRVPIRAGRCYRLYYDMHRAKGSHEAQRNCLERDQFLALEDLGEYRESEMPKEENSEQMQNG